VVAEESASEKSEQPDWAAAVNAVTCTILTVMTYRNFGDAAAAGSTWLAPIVAAVGGAFYGEN